MGKLFGTDGIRGIANRDLSPELAISVGEALATVLTELANGKMPTVYVGKDTRRSSSMIECAISAGLCSGGANVVLLGEVPTPLVAYIINKNNADAGIMISASHNPYEYNGIKVFGKGGLKLSDSAEEEIEDIILNRTVAPKFASSDKIGKVHTYNNPIEEYTDYIAGTVKADFSNLKVLIDCANGSTSMTAETLMKKIGLNATYIHNKPNGDNINDKCGSTHIELLKDMVLNNNYDLALAFDGDGDRCLGIDNMGNIIDGDIMIAIFAKHLKEKNKLKNNTAVVTVMSNYGFMDFGKKNDIDVIKTKVGDRYVLEAMLKDGHCIGGEQSGHIIFSDYMTTGDGELTAVQLLQIIAEYKQSLSEIAKIINIFPQVLLNVEATTDMKLAINESVELQEVIHKYENQLSGRGRILLRPSGTEPLIRVMAEGDNIDEITDIVNDIAKCIGEFLA